jgi:hypothetical protein
MEKSRERIKFLLNGTIPKKDKESLKIILKTLNIQKKTIPKGLIIRRVELLPGMAEVIGVNEDGVNYMFEKFVQQINDEEISEENFVLIHEVKESKHFVNQAIQSESSVKKFFNAFRLMKDAPNLKPFKEKVTLSEQYFLNQHYKVTQQYFSQQEILSTVAFIILLQQGGFVTAEKLEYLADWVFGEVEFSDLSLSCGVTLMMKLKELSEDSSKNDLGGRT